MNDDTALASQKELMRLMTQHQRRIFSYIYTLVPYRADAEDILQETSLVVCEKFGQFKIGTDFAAWAADRAGERVCGDHVRQRAQEIRQLMNRNQPLRTEPLAVH